LCFKVHHDSADSTRGRIGGVGIYDAELCRYAGVEQPDFFPLDEGQQLLGFLIGDDELDFNRQRARKLEEVLFVQGVMAAESSHGTEGRATADAEFVGLFEQPFPREAMAVALAFLHVESQE
jgi:hypothetical protein